MTNPMDLPGVQDVSGHYPEPSEAAKKVEKLKTQNARALERITALGAEINPMSLDAARDAHLMGWIYTNVMTESQREDFLISWHEAFAEQLKKIEGQAREQKIARERAGAGKLVTPAAGKLIVPGR